MLRYSLFWLPLCPSVCFSFGSHKFQCRSHTKTAYFVVPKDVEHGDGLRCSHVMCQNKGIRFVYCQFCKVPVAKINFTTRHKHKNLLSNTSTTSSRSKGGTKRKLSQSEDCDESPKSESESSYLNSSADATSSGYASSESNSSARKKKSKKKGSDHASRTHATQERRARRRRWVALLHERPPRENINAMRQ